jgi:MOSC domain-containing protein
MGRREHAEAGMAAARSGSGRVVGRVAELWRYPVKSMRSGTVAELLVTDRGSVGDRAWALRDPSNGRVASAKRFPRLLEFRATYDVEPTPATSGRVRIEAPAVRWCTRTIRRPPS